MSLPAEGSKFVNDAGDPTDARITEWLRVAATDLAASAIGITPAGGAPRFFTRNACAAIFFHEIATSGLESLVSQTQAKGGVFGANRVKSEAEGATRGRLIAVALRTPAGAPIGLLIATRLIDEPKFGARESQRLLALAPEIAAVLAPGRADPPRAACAPLLDWNEFERHIRAAESRASVQGCVIYGDMDQLHVINTLAGFGSGDRAISDVRSALQAAQLPAGACVCHISGDRFTVYLPATTLAQGRRIAEQLSRSVSALPTQLNGTATPLSISFGVAVIPSAEGGLGHALAAAESACKAAKDRGRGRVEVFQDADQSIVRRNDDVLVAERLRQALASNRVAIFAQPIVRLREPHVVTHYELLARIVSDAGTHLSPAWFMSAATRYRMLPELDRAVMRLVFETLERHRATVVARNIRFSVNLSGPSIGDPEFLEWLGARIGSQGVPGERLVFEITETAAVANVSQTQALMRRLKARGVQFALDDFGTGVSSFAYLKLFDVAMLKLDGSFVRDLLANPRSESLVRGIAQLGHGMGLATVAECVESDAIRARLTELGIDSAQGFHFGRPQPVEDVLGALSAG